MLREINMHEAGAPGLQTSEYRERHKDGHWMRILSRGKIIAWSPDGKPARIIGTDADITSLKSAEEKLQFANTLLTTQMETSPDGILVVDANARIISFNRRFADMWGISLDLLEAKDDAPVLAAVMSSMKDPHAFVARVKYLYEHPEEGGRDELETTDGRFFDRHTGVLRTPTVEAAWPRLVLSRHHRAQTGRSRDSPDRALRCADGARQPRRLHGGGRARDRQRQTRRQDLWRALPRPRSVQGRERHAGPSHRR